MWPTGGAHLRDAEPRLQEAREEDCLRVDPVLLPQHMPCCRGVGDQAPFRRRLGWVPKGSEGGREGCYTTKQTMPVTMDRRRKAVLCWHLRVRISSARCFTYTFWHSPNLLIHVLGSDRKPSIYGFVLRHRLRKQSR